MCHRACETIAKVPRWSLTIRFFIPLKAGFNFGSMVFFRHGFLQDNDLGPLYDLLIDDPPDIRRAIGGLVYDHLIAQKFSTSQRKGWNFSGSVLHYDLQAGIDVHENILFR